MVFGRPPLPKRALGGATIGALYGLFWLLQPLLLQEVVGIAWFLLSVGLLFYRTMSYHVFVFWALLWVVWRSILDFRASPLDVTQLVVDLAPPAAALILLMTSDYRARAAALDADAAEA
jgi:hypothetical protein